MIPNEMMRRQVDDASVAALLILYPVVMTGICRFLMRAWRPVSLAIEDADEWLSDIVLPEWLHWPAAQALVIRHGVPLVFTGAMLYSFQGFAALFCYTLLMLAWIFLSPYRHPQVYIPVREAIKTFFHVPKRKTLVYAAMIGVSAMGGSYQYQHQKPHTTETTQIPSTLLDCTSDQAMNLMDKECKNALMPERCAKGTREQKISQCQRIQARLQKELGQPSTPTP